MKKKAVVIGSGIGGLASAIRLAVKGYETHVYERNSSCGGKIGEIKFGDCRFDTGPSLFTLPGLVDELFVISGENPRDHFSYLSLPSSCRYFYEDGTLLDAWTDRQRFAEEVETKTGEPASNVTRFLDKCAELYELTSGIFIFSPFYRFENFKKPESMNVARNFRKLDAFSTMHGVINRHFSNPRVIQLFDRYATYNGSSPYKAPGTLNVIAHLEHNLGAYFPVKGMRSIVDSVVSLAERKGVIFHKCEEVLTIGRQGRTITEVETPSGSFSASVFVSDIDTIPLYRKLMKDERSARKQERQERSTSALIFYWVMNRRFGELDLHNIFFSSDYPVEFRSLGKGAITDDPTVYVFVSSRVVPSDAPAGKDNWFVMINVPADSGQDWDRIITRVRERIADKLSRRLGYDIKSAIEAEEVLDPVRMERMTLSHRGALYGSSSNSRFAAFRRHPNVRNMFENLWFTGGTVHPGGGIPLCLASAKIACDMIPGPENID